MTIAFRQHRNTFSIPEIRNYRSVIRHNGINSKHRTLLHPLRVLVCSRQALNPQDQRSTVDGRRPPMRSTFSRHRRHKTDDLTAMDEDFLGLMNAPLVANTQLSTRPVKSLSACQPLNLRERGDGIETDEMIEHEVRSSDGTGWISFGVDGTQLVPFLEQRLHLFQPEHSACLSDRSATTTGTKEVREATQYLPQVAEQRLERVQQQLQLQRRELIVVAAYVIMEHILKQVAQRWCEGANLERIRAQPACGAVRLLENSQPLSRVFG